MSQIYELKAQLEEKWLECVTDYVARLLHSLFNEEPGHLITNRVKSSKLPGGSAPLFCIVGTVYSKYFPVLDKLGYLSTLDGKDCDNLAELIRIHPRLKEDWTYGSVHYMNERAREMYEKLRDDGYFATRHRRFDGSITPTPQDLEKEIEEENWT